MTGPDQRTHREVVSFVRRSTRMNPSQERAWANRERYLIEVPRAATSTSIAETAVVGWPAVFGRRAELVVEIGSGTGDSLVAMAGAAPDRDHVAFEVFRPALASTMIKLQQAGIENVRLVDANGVEGLNRLFGTGSVTELWTFFPDPWHKSRHHKRRLVSTEFADLVADRLVPGGLWRIATDWADYAEHCREVLDPHPRLVNVDADSSDLIPRPETKYERRGVAAGRAVIELAYRSMP
ncbi:tRNA (guanosine(46)-N7)-methyltransferase TrmB [Enemella evansiae]|uniref:tRNA (guanosine(46)-N7)-methyltransferase TrmB n=1 Tax=Enemella evansiae TaxID=2016499 RepID=UPI000B95E961|nr:tRNA (guanosine(46)-N7)-methyltransferase TrmB [Enemella evansiae]OYO01637.1 tRNA (guanosine(46)-N7)-methyltransferase TrmB [Enemella evansiae]OYO03618.1 tRNA (guanosine(46)-N7)-methyltransferase TrmB [Enemella evansiae]PFG68453.1 tRNA (guanine-N7-)-methyltransferase [Propionibacteriaceae bacterium ES.041]